jgi:CheY-like chemotaxis protein
MADILVIDDDAQVRAWMRMALKSAGHQVREAGDGAEGVETFRRQPSDMIFCDLFMPGKEGLETIRELRREFPDMPVVAMSGGGRLGHMDMLRAARLFGAVDVLQKPFGNDALLAAVEQALDGCGVP